MTWLLLDSEYEVLHGIVLRGSCTGNESYTRHMLAPSRIYDCQRRVKTELGRTGWCCCHHGIGMYPWIRSHIWVVFIINSYELGQQCKGSWQFHETLSVIWSPVNGWLLFNVNEKYSHMNFSIAPIHKVHFGHPWTLLQALGNMLFKPTSFRITMQPNQESQ